MVNFGMIENDVVTEHTEKVLVDVLGVERS